MLDGATKSTSPRFQKKSMIERVYSHACHMGDKNAFVFLNRGNKIANSITWSDLWERSSEVASGMAFSGPPNKFGVVILCQSEQNFLISLLAVWMQGGVVIPAMGALNIRLFERNAHIIEKSAADMIVHDHDQETVDKLVSQRLGIKVVKLDEIQANASFTIDPYKTTIGGLIQFTSGSTADPKPVRLSAQNIEANCAAIQESFGLNQDSKVVHWLPLYHDMGLVGSLLLPLWSGATSVILKPSTFIQNPLSWFQALSDWQATITSAPNFAYHKIAISNQQERTELDLTSLKTVIIGGEPVLEKTIKALLKKFSRNGLNYAAITPCYGLAESTLLVSSGSSSTGPKFDSSIVDRPVAALGTPIRGLKVKILHRKTRSELDNGKVGQIEISGSSVGQVISEGSDWRAWDICNKVTPGDLGYILNGELYVTGRVNNKFIIRGKNIYAEDVEQTVANNIDIGAYTGIAAIALEEQGSEEITIIIEKERKTNKLDFFDVNKAIGSRLGIKLSNIIVVRFNTLPRTSSGKIQREVVKKQFLSGAYKDRILQYEN